MSDGHIKDPQMNDFKEFGYLLWDQCKEDEAGKDLKCRTLIYLKDDESKYYNADTPVTFDVIKRSINGCQVELAKNVREDPTRIKFHPVIKKLNRAAMKALDRYLDDC